MENNSIKPLEIHPDEENDFGVLGIDDSVALLATVFRRIIYYMFKGVHRAEVMGKVVASFNSVSEIMVASITCSHILDKLEVIIITGYTKVTIDIRALVTRVADREFFLKEYPEVCDWTWEQKHSYFLTALEDNEDLIKFVDSQLVKMNSKLDKLAYKAEILRFMDLLKDPVYEDEE